MQSLYKVIKATVIQGNNIIAPPVIDIPEVSEIIEDNSENVDEHIPDEYDNMLIETQSKIEAMLSEARENAKTLLEKAKNDAAAVCAKAKDEGYQEGYRNGYKDGYDFGLKEANNEGKAIRQDAETYLKSSHEEVKNFISRSKDEIIKLSVEIARHILNTEITINSDAIYKITEKAVAKSVDKKQLIIKVSPEDFNYLKNKRDELSMYVEDSNNIFIIADPAVKHTGIKIESPSGFVDASIDSQLDIILKSLTGEKNNDKS